MMKGKNMKTITNITYSAFAAIALACFGLLPTVRAVDPPPDGGYPNENTAEGDDALVSLTDGGFNTALGFNALYSNTTGFLNTATGRRALESNTTGNENSAYGASALRFNTTGTKNTAIGRLALFSNTEGLNNTATGYNALVSNTTGSDNTATGFQALNSNTTGIQNTANGFEALYSNTTGEENTATGVFALRSNTGGVWNTAYGTNALISNDNGGFNVANGSQALFSNANGNNNTAVGANALFSNQVDNTTAVGAYALASNTTVGTFALTNTTTGFTNTAVGQAALFNNTTGWENVALGAGAGLNLTTGHSNIVIGSQVVGVAGESNTIRIGTQGTQRATFIAGIRGSTVGGGATVVVNAAGKLGVAPSSARFKDAIKPMDKASEAILALKPVTFRYKKEIDPEDIPEFGLVAEDVEKVNPDLVVRDAEGKVYSVRYEAVNAMLLNEFLKEHRTVQEQDCKLQEQQAVISQIASNAAKQEATIALQQQEIKALTTNLREQASQIQKVNAQLEIREPTPQT